MVELAARVQLGVNDLDARNAQLRMHIHRNAAPVVLHADATVLVQLDLDLACKAVGRLVDRIVYDLPYQMMKTSLTR